MKLEDKYATTITLGDYDKGVRQNCQKCLVAQAVIRMVPGCEVSVGSPQSIRINEHVCYVITQGYNLIDDFDGGVPPENLVGRTLEITRAWIGLVRDTELKLLRRGT